MRKTAASQRAAQRSVMNKPFRQRAESVLASHCRARQLPAGTTHQSTITQIYEGTNQIQRMVMARQLLKG